MTIGPSFESALAAAQRGAEWALTVLYRDLHPQLLRYLLAEEPTEGEDLASEVWLDVGTGLARFQGDERDLRAWVFTIARRRLIDLRRSGARRHTVAAPNETFHHLPDRGEPFEAATGLLKCLRVLPPEHATIVLLRVVGGLDSNEVAAVTGKKPGTVRVIQKRALERLAEVVASERTTSVTR
jgi:RNA polymerase sigma-70 factor, ECF subfamily